MLDKLRIAASLCAHVKGKTLPEGWEQLPKSYDMRLPVSGFTASIQAYCSKDEQQAVLVCHTQENVGIISQDLIPNYLNYIASRFNSCLVELECELFPDLDGFNTIVTGFGLGGCLAELFPFEFDTHCIAFDPPGNHFFLASAFPQLSDKELTERARNNCHIFLTLPNPINTFDEHVGNIFRLKIAQIESTSWKHIGLSTLDWASFAANLFTIGSMAKAGSKAIQVAAASGQLAEKQAAHETALLFARIAAEETAQATLTEAAFQQALHNPATMQLADMASKVNAARDAIRVAQSGLQAATATMSSAATGAATSVVSSAALQTARAQLTQLSKQYQHNIDVVVNFFSGEDGHVSTLIIPMQSWPKTHTYERTWGRFFTDFILPTRGIYVFNENAYLEASKVYPLPGYLETSGSLSHIPNADLILTTRQYDSGYRAEDLSGQAITSRALITILASMALHPKMDLRNLQTLQLSHNALDDEAVTVLCMQIQLSYINLSFNRITHLGYQALLDKIHNGECQFHRVNLSNNLIFFDYNDVSQKENKIEIDLSANFVCGEIDVASNVSHAEIDLRRQRNQELHQFVHAQNTWFSGIKEFDSIIDGAPKLTRQHSLVFLMARGEWVSQHALILIERITENNFKELVIYELLAQDDKAFVKLSIPDLGDKRFSESILNPSVYQHRCHRISKQQEATLFLNLNNDVRKGKAFNYHKLGFNASDGTQQVNCARWAANHLELIKLPSDLGWLSLPSDLVPKRGWFS